MKTGLRRTVAKVAAVSLAVALAACGKAGQSDGPSENHTGGDPRIGVLFPETHTARWEEFDRPLVEQRIKELCDGCEVEYGNAQGDVATQRQQVDSLITNGIDVLILSAVNSRSLRPSVEQAQDAGVPVIAYDHLVDGPIAAHVTFSNLVVGRLQARALLDAMGDKARGGQIVMMNGDPGNAEAVAAKKGALSVLRGKVRIGKSYDTSGWRPEIAHTNMTGAIAALGADTIDGVLCANDGMASGVIAALRAAKISPLPPVTGQDAGLAAVQRIVAGEQYMTVYKPPKPQADVAAEMALALGRGKNLDHIATSEISNGTDRHIPAVLLDPVPVTADTIEETVVRDGVFSVEQLCARDREGCDRAGLTG